MQSVIKRKQLIKALNNDSVLCYDTDDNMILVCQALLITTAEHGFFFFFFKVILLSARW